ncbi:MAG TPA: hypothetical protein VKG84_07165 [Candidatus Acidoferrales bacterium]|nr:hypothetical protein [Candidatus Acidoferrales bacterium]
MTRFAGPPVEYLRECSSTSLRYFEMSKLEHVANLRKELTVLLDEMMEESALALFARWMLEKRTGAAAPGNGHAAGAGAARRARRLLADFVAASAGLHGPAASAEAAERPQGGAAPQEGEAGLGFGDLAFSMQPPAGARGHVPPVRGSCRAEKRVERKSARPSRLCAKSSSESS